MEGETWEGCGETSSDELAETEVERWRRCEVSLGETGLVSFLTLLALDCGREEVGAVVGR